jgi:hypothetical protein
MEMFRTRQLVLDPPTEINAASSISARGCLRLSSIYLLVHDWSQSKVLCWRDENPPNGGCRAGSRMGWTRRSAGTPHRTLAPDSAFRNVELAVLELKTPAPDGNVISGTGAKSGLEYSSAPRERRVRMLPPDLVFRKCETCGAGQKTPPDGDQGAGPMRKSALSRQTLCLSRIRTSGNDAVRQSIDCGFCVIDSSVRIRPSQPRVKR